MTTIKSNRNLDQGSDNVVLKPETKEERNMDINEKYRPFMSEGFVSLCSGDISNSIPIKILSDTGATQSLLLEGILPLSVISLTGDNVIIQGVELGYMTVPLHKINLKSDLVSGDVVVGVRQKLPVEGIALLLGNDLAGDKVVVNPLVASIPRVDEKTEKLEQEFPGIFPACVTTRGMKKKALEAEQSDDNNIDLSETFWSDLNQGQYNKSRGKSKVIQERSQETNDNKILTAKKQLILDQENDPEISNLIQRAVGENEVNTKPVCFYKQDGVLLRKWRPPEVPANEEWKVVNQIVVPPKYRKNIISLAHDNVLSGHLGVNKTHNKILQHFYWPKMRVEVANFCKTCDVCQRVGKPNQIISRAPLKPIPAFEEPFSKIMIDCVGPLPKTKSGNQYLLTIMCTSTRFPEAIPLKSVAAPKIVKALTKFFTYFGLPKSIQSDQGSNFMSGLFQQVMHTLGIDQFKSSAYHPESQGALERFHQTLKTMMKAYCLENQKDEGIHFLLFAVRESVQESIGLSPFELVFGHMVRGPLKLLKETWLEDNSSLNLLDYVSSFNNRLLKATEITKENLKGSQAKMKVCYDKKARQREFKPGDKVLVLLPISGHPLRARYYGPCTIESKLSEENYVVKTPNRRRQTQLCHINMLKPYYDRDSKTTVEKVNLAFETESRDTLENI